MSSQVSRSEGSVKEADMNYFFQRLLVAPFPESSGLDDNAIKQRHVYISGSQGAGKSNTAKWIIRMLLDFYGEKQTNVQSVPAEQFRDVLESKWEKKPVQVILTEDLTETAFRREDLHEFFNIRHRMEERTELREGLCIILFTCHRLHSTPLAFRSEYDALIIQSAPVNDWDHDFIEAKVGDRALAALENSEEKNEQGLALVMYKRKFLGTTRIPKIQENLPIHQVNSSTASFQLFSGKKETPQNRTGHQSLQISQPSVKEKLLLLGMVLSPWLNVYSVIRYPYWTMATIGLTAVFSIAYASVRFARWLRNLKSRKMK